MEKRIKIKSTSLTPLNETLQKLKLNDTIVDFTPVIVEADGKFTSIVNTAKELDISKLGDSFETTDDEIETSQQKDTKEQLLNKAKDALKQTLTHSKELDDILQKIQDLSKDTDAAAWKVNKEHNTATLKNKNARIFKQNNNLCLSHPGKIEIFHSVDELHDWLKKNNYPLPGKDIVIHESIEIKEDGRNWVDLLNTYNDKKKADVDKIYDRLDTTTDDNQFAGLGKAISKEILQADKNKKVVTNPNRKFLQKNTDVDECCGGACVSTAALGPAVAYTTVKTKKESVLEEAIASFIPNDFTKFEGNRPAVNKFLSWFKRNKPSIESGKIKLPSDFETTFDTIIEPTFLNNASDSMSKTWNKLILNRLRKLAARLSQKNNIPEDVLLQSFVKKPNTQICDLLSEELNKYIPDTEKYAFGKVKLIPNQPLLDTSKRSDNLNYQQRLNWQKAGFQAKINGAVDNSEVMVKTFNDLKTFIKQTPQFTDEENELIKKYGLFTKESNLSEASNKYPWLNKVLNTRLVEDDSPADFAQGSPISPDIATTSTNTSTTSNSTDDLSLDIPDFDSTGSENSGASFGDINIDASGYSPDEMLDEIPEVANLPEYKIIDVLLNDDTNEIKVKTQNTETKEIEIKDLEDIDV